MSKALRERVENLIDTIDRLLLIRYPGDAHSETRYKMTVGYLSASVSSLSDLQASAASSLENLVTKLGELSESRFDDVKHYALYFACEELVYLIAAKNISNDCLRKEEAIFYIQERLLLDNFRRIASYSPDKNTSFNTYISRVINNLLLDFLRKSSRENKAVIRESSLTDHSIEHADTELTKIADQDIQSGFVSDSEVEQSWTSEQLAGLVSHIFAKEDEDPSVVTEKKNIRQQLRTQLSLTCKERIFLKTLFIEELNINEIRKLPGFDMTTNEAYKYYHTLMAKLAAAFRDLGLFKDMRSLLVTFTAKIDLLKDNEVVRILVAEIVYMKEKSKQDSLCYIADRDGLSNGVVNQALKKVHANHPHDLSMVASHTLVGDEYVEELISERGESNYFIKVERVEAPFRVAKSYVKSILAKFAKI